MRPATLHYSLTGQHRVIFPSLGCSVSSPSRLHGHRLSGASLHFFFSRRRAKDSYRKWQSNQVAREFTRTSTRPSEQVEGGAETDCRASPPRFWHKYVSLFHPLPRLHFTLRGDAHTHTHKHNANSAAIIWGESCWLSQSETRSLQSNT